VRLVSPDAAIGLAGPWTHRDVAAHGARFHIVEMGQGPAVVLLHGFPGYWWSWRHQLQALAQAGYRAIAMDLRGYAGSDHTPHGYDPFTLAADVTSVIRSLGEQSAVLVGHGWGALIAWTAAVQEPHTVKAVVAVAGPHPRALRAAAARPWTAEVSLGYALGFQLPFWPEHSLTKNDAVRVEHLLRTWSATPNWPDGHTASMYRSAFMRWPTAHTSIEFHRWALRSVLRSDGRRFMSLMRTPVTQDVLMICGTHDPMVSTQCCRASRQWVSGTMQTVEVHAGHFPHEEAPEECTAALLHWLAQLH